MKIIKTLLLVVFIGLTLSACTEAKIKYEIDKQYNVNLHYTATIDLSNVDNETRRGVLELCQTIEEEYMNIGFISNSEFDKSMIKIDLLLTKKNSNLEEAYSTLHELLINPDISYMLYSDITSSNEKYQSAYNIEFETDLPAILDSTGMNDLPPTIKNPLIEQINASNIMIELVLPYSTIVEMSESMNHSNTDTESILSMKINNDSPTNFKVMGKISLSNNKVIPKDMESSIQSTINNLNLFNYLIVGGGALSVISIISLAYFLSKNRQST